MRIFSVKMRHGCPLVCAAFALLLQGCIVSGGKTDKSSPDMSLLTGSVINGQDIANDRISLSDQKIIHDLITGMDKKDFANKSLNWSNKDTGSRGIISTVTEAENTGQTCRTFQTTRESFDGIMLLSGKTCKEAGTSWKMVDFRAL